MSIESARQFINRAMVDQGLRDALNVAEGWEGRVAVLAKEGYDFSPCECGDAFRNLLTQCQTEEAAAEVQDLQQWWELLQQL